MAGARHFDLVRFTTSTTGTGSVTVGSAVSGFKTPVGAGVVDGVTYSYAIKDGSNSETGRAVFSSTGTVMSRTVNESTNSDNALNLSGSAEVFLTPISPDWASGVRIVTGASDTILGSDHGKLIIFNRATAIAVTLPQSSASSTGFQAGFQIWVYNINAGTATITPTTSTINGAATLAVAQSGGAMIVADGTNYSAQVLGAASSASETVAGIVELATAAETLTGTDTGRAVHPSGLKTTLTGAGSETIWVPATAMIARTTNGAASGTSELTTNKIMVKTLDFDAATIEYAQFMVRMPKSWDLSTMTAVFEWCHATTTVSFGVVWAIQAMARSDAEALDNAFGTAVTVTDTGATADVKYTSAATGAMTVGSTPAAEDLVVFQVYRDATNGSDTLGVDAKLIGVTLKFGTSAYTDA